MPELGWIFWALMALLLVESWGRVAADAMRNTQARVKADRADGCRCGAAGCPSC